MVLANFQTEIGGRLQGLIGIKHSDSFPEAIFYLQNGLISFKQKAKTRFWPMRVCHSYQQT